MIIWIRRKKTRESIQCKTKSKILIKKKAMLVNIRMNLKDTVVKSPLRSCALIRLNISFKIEIFLKKKKLSLIF
jgi:hypothetical protein